jgi:phosphatidylglycerophosphatase A
MRMAGPSTTRFMDSITSATEPGAARGAPRRPSAAFMLRHPARWIALGFGSGLAPRAPGTVGTLWAWVAFLVADGLLGADGPFGAAGWPLAIVVALLVGWWACTRTAQHLGSADPGAIVWDEVVAFWIVLWILMPAGAAAQLAAFALFRLFDAAKPGPVGWADRRFKPAPGSAIGWRAGAGILFDDLVAAGCTLLVLALAMTAWRS